MGFWDFVKDGVEAFAGGAGAVADAVGYMANTFGDAGGEIVKLGARIFGGSDDDPWGMLGSPVFGHVVGAVGAELLKPTSKDRIEEQLELQRALEDDRQKRIRRNYGLDPNHRIQ